MKYMDLNTSCGQYVTSLIVKWGGTRTYTWALDGQLCNKKANGRRTKRKLHKFILRGHVADI